MARITSFAWNARYTDNDFKNAERDYGKLADNLFQLAGVIHNVADKLSDTKSNVSEILVMLDKDDELGNVYYVPTNLVKSIMNIHYSMLKLKPLIELCASEQEAKVLYNRSRKNLALKFTRYPNKKDTWYTWHGRNESVALAKQLERFHAFLMSSNATTGKVGKRKKPKKKLKLQSKATSGMEHSQPLFMKQWAYIFGVSPNKMRELRKGKHYHFRQVSPRKWTLPKRELPTEYLERFRSVIPKSQPKKQ